MTSWTHKQINQHIEAGKKLALIKDEFYAYICANKEITEIKCIEFVKKAYKKHGLVNDSKKEFAIVAFGKNTNQVHHFPAPKYRPYHLHPNTLVLLDIWARLPQKNAPYADATFMFFNGKKIPKEIQKTWNVLVRARDRAIEYIEKEIKKDRVPRGLDIDRIAHDIIGNSGLGKGIRHTIGHSLGFSSPHGENPGINWREYSPILKNVGYTIEPGVYLENFGMRTEINFYVNDRNEVIITTPLQDELEIIQI